jgi:uncharacterized protein YcbK (DUF882 family)
MKGPSKHLSWKELACKDGTPYPEIWRTNRAVKLSAVFEMIRSAFGDKPITVLSAYRTSIHNRSIGGARNSQHLEGRALDLKPPNGITPFNFYRVIKALAPDCGIKGIGLYKTFVHIDIRPTTNTAYWKGTGVKDSLA